MGSSGDIYNAPANGFVCVACTGSTKGDAYMEIVEENISECASYNGGWGRAMAAIGKNQPFRIYYGGDGFTTKLFRFVYANGTPSIIKY